MTKFTIRKYDGDDELSWAVFKSNDVKGMGNQIFFGEAKPITSGLSRQSASHVRDTLNKKRTKL